MRSAAACDRRRTWRCCRCGCHRSRGGGLLGWRGEPEPVEPVPTQGQQIRQLTYRRERDSAQELDGDMALPATQVELDGLREAREVVDAHDDVGLVLGAVLARVGE